MDFKTATDQLFAGVAHQQLADALGCKIPSIRQARLAANAHAHRTPPRGWQAAVARLAEVEARRLDGLAGHMRKAVEHAADEALKADHVCIQILKGGLSDGQGGTFTINSVASVAPEAAQLMIERGQAKLADE